MTKTTSAATTFFGVAAVIVFVVAAASGNAFGQFDPNQTSQVDDQNLLEASIIAEAKTNAEGQPDRLAGQITLSGIRRNNLCIALSYNNADYGKDRGTQHRMETMNGRRAEVSFAGGQSSIFVEAPAKVDLRDNQLFIPVSLPAGWNTSDQLKINFDSKMPLPPNPNEDEWFFAGAIPQFLDNCPNGPTKWGEQGRSRDSRWRGTINIPKGWEYAGRGTIQSDSSTISIDVLGNDLPFALRKSFQRLELKVAGTTFRLFYTDKSFLKLVPTLETVFPQLKQIFGELPWAEIAIIETAELQRHGLPGTIAMNTPRQSIFRSVQQDWVNWRHWIFSNLLANQWYGAAIQPESNRDRWLLDGITEYATWDVIRNMPNRFDLFNPMDSGFRLISFNYRQVLDVSAATLFRFDPFLVLTTANFENARNENEQHPLQHIRQAIAMVQLAGASGRDSFHRFLQSLSQARRHKSLQPKDFIGHIDSKPSPFNSALRGRLKTYLSRWWVDEGWPDFDLESFKTKEMSDGQWLTEVVARQKGAIDFAPILGIQDARGREHQRRAEAVKNEDGKPEWRATFLTPEEPVYAEVDPGRETYDSDRFNNSNRWPSLKFFPGNAETVADDGYTLIWLPYALRRPGEPVSLAMQGALFRYVQSGLFFNFEYAPQGNLGSVLIRQRYQVQEWAIHGDLKVDQRYEGERLAEASMVRSPLFDGNPHISLNLAVRGRSQAGQPDSPHPTLYAGIGLKPPGRNPVCSYNLDGSIERAPKAGQQEFSYERSIISMSGHCNAGRYFSVSLRLFGGQLAYEGEQPPPSSFFKVTDLAESRIRLDIPGLARPRRLGSANFDLEFPLPLPLSDNLLVLTRRVRWRIFYDHGQSEEPNLEYQSSGLGFTIPFGGDLTGAGSLSLTRIAFLAVLYSRAGELEEKRPGFIFSVSGDI